MKGQITIFMILGLILLVIFVGFFMFVNQSSDVQTVSETTFEQEFTSKVALDTCLQNLVYDAVELLGKQGGVIYTGQGGTYYDISDEDDFILYPEDGSEHSRVFMGIRHNPAYFLPQSFPQFPLDVFILEQSARIWGGKTLPPLCDLAQQQTDCLAGMSGAGPRTVQHQIKEYVEIMRSDTDVGCRSFEGNLLDWSGSSLEVVINLDDVTLYAEDLSFIEAGSTAITIDARLKRAYTILHQIVENDISSILFLKPSGFSTMEGCQFPEGALCLTDGFQTNVERNIVNTNGADVVFVVDEQSIINGKPLMLRTAIENRRPAINLFGQSDGVVIPPQFEGYVDFYAEVPENYDLKLNPFAFDPDEDVVTAYYEGWGQDYISLFDHETCCVNGICTYGEDSCITELPPNHVQFMDSDDYLYNDDCGLEICANLNVDIDERGIHDFRIGITDGHPLGEDYRDYSVLVGDAGDTTMSLADLLIYARVPEDDCDFFSDWHHHADQRQGIQWNQNFFQFNEPIATAQMALNAINGHPGISGVTMNDFFTLEPSYDYPPYNAPPYEEYPGPVTFSLSLNELMSLGPHVIIPQEFGFSPIDPIHYCSGVSSIGDMGQWPVPGIPPGMWDLPIDNRTEWIRYCDMPVTAKNRLIINQLHDPVGGSGTFSNGDTVTACYTYNWGIPWFAFYLGVDGITTPFDNVYNYEATGDWVSPPHSYGLACASDSKSTIGVDPARWTARVSQNYPISGNFAACKYLPDMAGCGCWLCDQNEAPTCTFFTAYE